MGNVIKKIWDELASGDERLATDGFNACNDNPLAQPIGTPESVAELFTPVPGQWLLDLGCGWGKMAIPCLRAGMTVVGADISTVMLRKLSQKAEGFNKSLHLVNSEFRHLPFASSLFDVVWSHSVLMHLPRHEAEEGIAEIARVMRPDGRGFLHFRNSYHILEIISRVDRLLRGLGEHQISPIYRRTYSLAAIKRLLSKYFGRVQIWVESFDLIPVVMPERLFGAIGSLSTGIPELNPGTLRPLGTVGVARALTEFFDILRRFSNGPLPVLKHFGKEFVAQVQQPCSPQPVS